MLARAVGVVRPDAGQAIGLQLEPHRQRVGLLLRRRAAARLHLLGDAEQVLHVMPDLVRDHVGLREIARRLEALAQLAVEAEVDVDLLIGRAVERTHRRLREAARRLHRAGEQHQLGLLVLRPGLPEQRAPGVLGVGQHHRDESCHRVVGRRLGRRAGLLDGALGACALQQQARIDAEDQREHDQDDRPEPAAHHAGGHPHPAAVLDVVASPAGFPTHRFASMTAQPGRAGV